MAYAAKHDQPRGNLSDLYPRWLGARELLLHRRNPYSREITLEVQEGYYGRRLDPARDDDPKDQQAFAYPIYVVFLLAPLIGLPFHTVQILFYWMLIGLTVLSALLWLHTLQWSRSIPVVFMTTALMLGSFPAVQGFKLQQLTLLVAALIAIAAFCIANRWLLAGGLMLALATIKPQLAWPTILWMVVWAVSDWKARRRVVLSFIAGMGALLVGAELVLSGWASFFLKALREYHQYTHNESVLDLLVNGLLGRFGGDILAGMAVGLTAIVLWRGRNENLEAEQFGRQLALVLALTVLIVPMFAPYNQVLLLPSILSLWRERTRVMTGAASVRVLFVAGLVAVVWPWIATITLTAIWFASHDRALELWKLPLYSTFALPVLVFALSVVSIPSQRSILRFQAAAE
ncbi:MAG TPA: glycosyltransferase 87 family protein [Candidatus Sulfotelmatobacter sp.]|nr:glycosyltransferase 87 family protein [Candidatus Sulfotelmatobacter sp.]